ncbi:hypothetical protein O6H91_07G025500 [Diphasiastrum complanatum]|uniref:Uncharacterized protein n=1 Tax=Diphasiastrum complanatum TaxID=34168 RepID=A0ACC2D3M2_DIPCM|nr:hypothetical protein O6H91_07G025500 [Diphasiastrum complanatum]
MVVLQAALQASNTICATPSFWRLTQHLHQLRFLSHQPYFHTFLLDQQQLFYSPWMVRTISTSRQSTNSKSGKDGNERMKLLEASSSFSTIRTRILRGGPATWSTVALLSITGVGVTAYILSERKTVPKVPKQAQKVASSTNKDGHKISKTGIGGPFRLINQQGKIVSDRDFAGKWPLIYFGYSHCPDDCPEELQKMAQAIESIEAQVGDKVVPIFVSIDPERDDVAQLRAYLKEFSPKIVGLTGGVNDTRQIAQEYRVFYKKTEEEDSDYLVDHSNNMYLMNPSMEYAKSFGREYDAEALAAGVIEEMKQLEPQPS